MLAVPEMSLASFLSPAGGPPCGIGKNGDNFPDSIPRFVGLNFQRICSFPALFLLLSLAITHAVLVPVSAQVTIGDNTLYKDGSFALLIGNSKFKDPAWSPLTSIPGELGAIQDELSAQGFKIFRDTVFENKTGREIETLLNEFKREVGMLPDARLVVFIASHGHTLAYEGYVVGADSPDPEMETSFLETSLSMKTLANMADEMRAHHAVFLLDCCFGGSIFKRSAATGSANHAVDVLSRDPSRLFLTSGGADESVPASSAFVPAFIRAIQNGRADANWDGYVVGVELSSYIQHEVARVTDNSVQVENRLVPGAVDRGQVVFLNRSRRHSEPIISQVIPDRDLPPNPSSYLGMLGDQSIELKGQFDWPREKEVRLVGGDELGNSFVVEANNLEEGRLDGIIRSSEKSGSSKREGKVFLSKTLKLQEILWSGKIDWEDGVQMTFSFSRERDEVEFPESLDVANTYEGSIGGGQVSVSLLFIDSEEKTVFGRYFSNARSGRLSGEKKLRGHNREDGKLYLEEYTNGALTGYFNLTKEKGRAAWMGSYVDGGGDNSLTVEFERIER